MGSQSRTFQKEVLRKATKDGSLHELFWMVEMFLPIRYGGGHAAAKYKDGVPVVPVGDDPASSAEIAELLRWQFEDSNRGRGVTFSLALTSSEAMRKTGAACYVWGEERTEPDTIDNICPECGQVRTTLYDQLWGCCGWSQVLRRRS